MNAEPSIGYPASQRRWVAAGVSARSVDPGTGTAVALASGALTAINRAIATCRDGVIVLEEGTYTLLGGIIFRDASDATFRGAGADDPDIQCSRPLRRPACGRVRARPVGRVVGRHPAEQHLQVDR